MPSGHKSRIKKLVESWYTFMGLQRWAAKRAATPSEAALTSSYRLSPPDAAMVSSSRPSAPSVYVNSSQNRPLGFCLHDGLAALHIGSRASESNPSFAKSSRRHPGIDNSLLVQLSRLPYELAVSIASDAFLSPQQAACVHGTAQGSAPSGRGYDWDQLEAYRSNTPPADSSLYSWPDDLPG